MRRFRLVAAATALFASLAAAKAPRAHTGPLGLFTIELPPDWREVEFHEQSVLSALLTPQERVAEPDGFTTGLKVEMMPLAESDAIRRTPLVAWARARLKGLLSYGTRYEQVPLDGDAGQPMETAVAGRPAVRQDFRATVRGTRCRLRLIQFFSHDMQFDLKLLAPEEEFGRREATFARMLETFRPLPELRKPARAGAPLDRDAAAGRVGPSVVGVLAGFPGGFVQSGTGLVVREDGLILTTFRIVHRDGLAAQRIRVLQNAAEGPDRTTEAEIVDALLREGPPRSDLALLRVRGDAGAAFSRPAPLAPLHTGAVRGGDAIVTLCMPVNEMFGVAGALRTFDGRLGSDPAQSPPEWTSDEGGGVDGSVCVSLHTGAVIGLVSRYGRPAGAGGGLTAIDRALERFPQLRTNPAGTRMDAAEHLELSRWLSASGRSRAARIELDLAAAGEASFDDRTRAFFRYQLSALRPPATTPDEHRAMLEAVLACDPGFPLAHFDLASLEAARKQADAALAAVERGAAKTPGWWGKYYYLASVNRTLRRHADALKAVAEALRLGGSFNPYLHRLHGLLEWESGHHDAAEQAFRAALEADPGEFWSRLLLAQLNQVAPRSDRVGAEAELNRALADYPREPVVHERYARFLRAGKKRPDLVWEHANAAVRIAAERGERPAASALDLVATLALERGGKEDRERALAAAIVLHAGSAERAHALLHRYWTARKSPALARAHAWRGGKELRKEAGAPPALTDGDMIAVSNAGYTTALFAETIASAGLDLDVSQMLAGIDLGIGFPEGFVEAARKRSRIEQVQGSRALAALIDFKYTAYIRKHAPEIMGTYENASHIPLTGIRVLVVYRDKQDKTLWKQTVEFLPVLLPVQPQSSTLFSLELPSWKELAGHGVTSKNVQRILLGFTSARNALFLRDLTPKDGRETKAGYSFRIENKSDYTVSNPLVDALFFDGNNKPVLTSSGTARRLPGVTIAPRATSGEIVVKDWTDPAWFRRVIEEAKPPAKLFLRVRIADADLR